MTELERRLQALAPEAFPPVPDVRAAVAASAARPAPAGPGSAAAARAVAMRRRAAAAARARARAGARARADRAVAAVPPRAGGARLARSRARARGAVPRCRAPGARPRWTSAGGSRRSPRRPPSGLRGRCPARARRARRRLRRRRRDRLARLRPGARPPPRPQTGLGLLVTELRATGVPDYVAKTAGPRTRDRAVRVDGAPGRLHLGRAARLLVELPGRVVDTLPARLAGNTVALERGDLVLRLEARFDAGAHSRSPRSLRTSGARASAGAAARGERARLLAAAHPVLAERAEVLDRLAVLDGYWPVPMRTRAVSLPGPQSIVPAVVRVDEVDAGPAEDRVAAVAGYSQSLPEPPLR